MLNAHDPPRRNIIIMPYISVTDPPDAMEIAIVAATAAQLLHIFHPVAIIARSPRSRDVCVCMPRRERVSFSMEPTRLEISR